MIHRTRVFLLGAIVLPTALRAQSLDLTIDHTGLSIGDSRLVRGIRLNFRDDKLERVDGINATIWMPYDDCTCHVNGLALGLPVTGARRLQGAGIGIFGVGALEDLSGIGVGGFGVGAGGHLRGIAIGGFGVGAGGSVTGLTFGGFGVGTGGDLKGITFGGFGTGAGRDMTGFQLGGFGVGAGGRVEGITVGGFGAGAGGDITGITIGGFGAGAGGNITGITIGGFGVGSGGTVRGLAIAGFGVGAPRIRGVVIASAAGGQDVEGGILAPLYFKIADDGRVRGVTASAFNHIKGEQFGISLGLLNYAWDLHGVQLGLLNYAGNNPPGLRLLPFFNRAW